VSRKPVTYPSSDYSNVGHSYYSDQNSGPDIAGPDTKGPNSRGAVADIDGAD